MAHTTQAQRTAIDTLNAAIEADRAYRGRDRDTVDRLERDIRDAAERARRLGVAVADVRPY